MALKKLTEIKQGDKYLWGTSAGDQPFTAGADAIQISDDEVIVNSVGQNNDTFLFSGRPEVELEVPGW